MSIPQNPDTPIEDPIEAPTVPVNPYLSPERMARRKFINQLTIGLGALGAVVTAFPVAAYILAPLFKETPESWQAVGPVDQYIIGNTVQVYFDDPSPLPWAGVTAKTAAWLRRTGDLEFTAYAVNCTHLGCPVSWLEGARLFMCPCHGGVYYEDGTVAGGPPPAALNKYPIRIVNRRVEVKAIGVPLPTE